MDFFMRSIEMTFPFFFTLKSFFYKFLNTFNNSIMSLFLLNAFKRKSDMIELSNVFRMPSYKCDRKHFSIRHEWMSYIFPENVTCRYFMNYGMIVQASFIMKSFVTFVTFKFDFVDGFQIFWSIWLHFEDLCNNFLNCKNWYKGLQNRVKLI